MSATRIKGGWEVLGVAEGGNFPWDSQGSSPWEDSYGLKREPAWLTPRPAKKQMCKWMVIEWFRFSYLMFRDIHFYLKSGGKSILFLNNCWWGGDIFSGRNWDVSKNGAFTWKTGAEVAVISHIVFLLPLSSFLRRTEGKLVYRDI